MFLSHPTEAYEFLRRVYCRGRNGNTEDSWFAAATDPILGGKDLLPHEDPETLRWECYCVHTGLAEWAMLPVEEELEGFQHPALCLTIEGNAELLMWERRFPQADAVQPTPPVATPTAADSDMPETVHDSATVPGFDEDEMRDALDPLGFKLLNYMLAHNQASYDKLAMNVWDDFAQDLTDAAVHGAKNDVNKFLRKKGHHRELTKPTGEKILRWKHV